MECPNCGGEVKREAIAGGGAEFFCPACGWGRDRTISRRAAAEGGGGGGSRHVPARAFVKLAVAWPLALAVALGPYAAIVWGIPALAEAQGWTFLDATPEDLASRLTPGYWIALAIYLGLAYLVSPSFDLEKLGMFGAPWIDNPFTFEDDVNRARLKLAILLAPGKIVWLAVGGTWRVLLRLALGR